MKFTLSLAVLAVVASQAMAVIPIPVKECTKSIIVVATDVDGCAAFAARHGTTFDNLLLWNQKLRKDCLNLDVGHPICVSITKGDGPLAPTGGVPPPAATSGAPAPSGGATGVPTGSASASLPVAVVPTTTTTKAPAATIPPPNSGAGANKSSMFLAAAGVVLSVAYML